MVYYIEADDDNCICASDKCFKPDVSRAGKFYYYCIITNRLGAKTSIYVSPRILVTVNDIVSAEIPKILTQLII